MLGDTLNQNAYEMSKGVLSLSLSLSRMCLKRSPSALAKKGSLSASDRDRKAVLSSRDTFAGVTSGMRPSISWRVSIQKKSNGDAGLATFEWAG